MFFWNIQELLQNSRHQKGYMHQGTVNITVSVSYISSHPLKFICQGTSTYCSPVICKLVINKHELIWVGVYWNKSSVCGWKLSGQLNDVECMVEGETAECLKRGNLWLLHLLMYVIYLLACCHNSLHLMLKFQTCFPEMVDLNNERPSHLPYESLSSSN